MVLKENLKLVSGEPIGRTCGSGGYRAVWIEDHAAKEVVWHAQRAFADAAAPTTTVSAMTGVITTRTSSGFVPIEE